MKEVVTAFFAICAILFAFVVGTYYCIKEIDREGNCCAHKCTPQEPGKSCSCTGEGKCKCKSEGCGCPKPRRGDLGEVIK